MQYTFILIKKHTSTFLLLLFTVVFSCLSCSQNNQINQEIVLTRLDSIKYRNNIGDVQINEPTIAIKQISFNLIGSARPNKIKTNLLDPKQINTEIDLQRIYQAIEITPDQDSDTQFAWIDLKFQINLTWLQQNNFNIQDIHIYQLNTPRKIYKTKFIETKNQSGLYETSLPGFSKFAIVIGDNISDNNLIQNPTVNQNLLPTKPQITPTPLIESGNKANALESNSTNNILTTPSSSNNNTTTNSQTNITSSENETVTVIKPSTELPQISSTTSYLYPIKNPTPITSRSNSEINVSALNIQNQLTSTATPKAQFIPLTPTPTFTPVVSPSHLSPIPTPTPSSLLPTPDSLLLLPLLLLL